MLGSDVALHLAQPRTLDLRLTRKERGICDPAKIAGPPAQPRTLGLRQRTPEAEWLMVDPSPKFGEND
jgi:hypothetical protein